MLSNMCAPRGFEVHQTVYGGPMRREIELNFDDGQVVGNMAPVVEPIFIGDPIMISSIDRRGMKARMGTGNPIRGIVLELFDEYGEPKKYRPQMICRKPWKAIICDDPNQEWRLMESGNMIRKEDHLFSNADLMDTGGNTLSGISGVCIDSRTISGAGVGRAERDQVQILGLHKDPTNSYDDRYTRYVVKINFYQALGCPSRPNHCDGDVGDLVDISEVTPCP